MIENNASRRLLGATPLALSLAALFSPYLAQHPVVSAALLSACGAGLRLTRYVVLPAVLLCWFGLARAEHRLARYGEEWERTRTAFGPPQRCAVHGRVMTSPVLRGDTLTFLARLDALDCTRGAYPGPVTARLYGGPATLTRGRTFEGVAQLGVVRLFRNTGLPDPNIFAARTGALLSGSLLAAQGRPGVLTLPSLIDRSRQHIRERIQATFLPSVETLARALVLGENDLSPEEAAAFSLSGLSHLLAVSGTHLVFAVASLVGALEAVLRRLPAVAERVRPDRFAALCGAPLACLYADLAGGSGSAWRAAWMLSTTYFLRGLDREPTALVAVSASVAVGWLFDPLAVFDLSFMLSLAATAGLLTLGRPAAAFCARWRPQAVRLFGVGVAATISSLLPCTALLAVLSPTLSVAGVFANVVVAPFGEAIALPLCLAHTLMGAVPLLERGTALVASGALTVVRGAALRTAEWTESVPLMALTLPSPSVGHVAVAGAALLATWMAARNLKSPRRRAVAWVAGVVFGGLALARVEAARTETGQPSGALRVHVLDVGQGDSTWVDLPNGELMVIDGGGFVGSPVDPGVRVLLPLLREHRRTRIDYLVLSHPHPDHFTGLVEVAKHTPIGQFWDTGQGLQEGAGPLYAELLQTLRERSVPILTPKELCEQQAVGGAQLDVLAPCPSFRAGQGANDNSWVFRLSHEGSAILFSGDAEEAAEAALLRAASERLPAQVLKVGHHGSRTSTTAAFLAAVHPQVATISTGVRNRYGHPHPQTLQTLADAGVATLRTDRDGSIVLTAQDGGWTVSTYRSLPASGR